MSPQYLITQNVTVIVTSNSFQVSSLSGFRTSASLKFRQSCCWWGSKIFESFQWLDLRSCYSPCRWWASSWISCLASCSMSICCLECVYVHLPQTQWKGQQLSEMLLACPQLWRAPIRFGLSCSWSGCCQSVWRDFAIEAWAACLRWS